jgi:hypothetical protein
VFPTLLLSCPNKEATTKGESSMRNLVLGLTVVLALVVGVSSVRASNAVDSSENDIVVAPNVLNLQSSGIVVTVHTAIPYSEVYVSSVYLNGVEIQSWKADSQGFFVAKFEMDAIKDLPGLEVGINKLTLTASTTGGTFEGSQDILVIDNVPAGGK